MQRNPMTQAGYDALVRELKNAKEVQRPKVVRDLEEARAHGDISENSEYEDAKERQAHIEGRIAELERLVATAEIIDVKRLPRNGKVVFGTTVVLGAPNGEERRYRIVGEQETDVNAGMISFKSPLAKALIGHTEGEEVEVPAPGGVSRWEIIEVRYEE